jgi:hypothetical protein
MEVYIMFLKKTPTKKGTYLAIAESYYENGKSKQRTITPIGYLENLKAQYPDPIAHFKEVARQLSVEKSTSKNNSITIDLTTKMENTENNLKNVGYGILKELYKQLELDIFWKKKAQGKAIKYNLELIFRLLVISRILYPASKMKTYEDRSIYFEKIDGFSLDDIYNALNLIDDNQEALQKWIYEHSEKICKRDLSVTYFDCTNYYFDIGRPDLDILGDDGEPVDKDGNKVDAKYRKRGPEKNHRPDPIVEMGLLMDRNGIPLAFDLFPGNESEKRHMRPIINRIKTEFTDSRIIFVADRGLNTSDNIYYLNGHNKGDYNQRDGYVYGQSIRGASDEFKKWVIADGYQTDILDGEDSDEKVQFKHKSRIHPKELNVNVTSRDGKTKKKKKVVIDQKQMVYYSEKYAKKQRQDRAVMVERAKDLIKNPKKYDRVTSAGAAAYVMNIAFDKTTGEIVKGRNLEVDLNKIEEQALYDGYYSIVTSELEMSDLEMREVYRGLTLIEDTFKISKNDFKSRPVYVRTNQHIEAHFATCFTALVLIRLLQAKLNHQFPVGRILNSLKKYCCVKLDVSMYQFIYYDEIIEACEKAFGIEMRNQYRSQLQVRRMLRY